MLVTMLTAGSRGDLQPYLALGRAIQDAGHRARIATFENYAEFVKSFSLEFFPVKGDVTRVIASSEVQGAIQADNPLKVLASFNTLKSMVYNLQQDFHQACAGSDAIVYHPGAAIGYFIAQEMNIPSIFAPPFPMTPTREYPSLIFYRSKRLGRMYNLATHKIIEQILWFVSRAPVKQYWKKTYNAIPRNFTCPYGKQITQRLPTIISCSNFVFPRPADWSEHVYNTGYWFLDDETEWKPPIELLRFLEKGTPPVYIGFGSAGIAALADQTTRLVIDALKLAGQRGILATGWQGMSTIDHIPDDIFILESASHTWLFPRMAAVVHHGGAGTTAAGLRAGVPGVIIPHGNDQFAWGQRIHELGVGVKPIPRKKLTKERLAEAITTAITKELKVNAQDLGMKIKHENGVDYAARIILASR